MLSGPGKRFLHDPRQLKYLLAPVVAHSAAEQERFYAAFDVYYAEATAPPQPETGPVDDKRRIPRWLPWLIAALALATGALLLRRLLAPPPPAPELYIETVPPRPGPVEAAPGDTLRLRVAGQNFDTSRARFVFEVLENDRAEYRDTVRSAWTYVVGPPRDTFEKELQLRVEVDGRPRGLRYSTNMTVLCPGRPRIDSLLFRERVEPGEPVAFAFAGSHGDDLRYRWDFGDGNTSTAPAPEHTYEEGGVYTVSLAVERPGATGYCTAVRSREIAVDEQKAFLFPLPLRYEARDPRATFALGAWLLLGLIGAGIVYYWVRWAARKPEKEEEPAPAGADRLAASDRAPYFIPWRDAGGLIRVGREPLRLADVLRLRQEGLRREVDVPWSVRATIDQGGFPELRFRYNTQPTEYLFLIEEQHRDSHQTRLFGYLTGLLREQDVHIEAFFHNADFFRVWNHQYPGGLSLELLHRLYPGHRLVVLGDGHGLIDPHAPGEPTLRRPPAAALSRWRHRLLLTPRPPASWTYREALLHRLFPLFPADLAGQMDAARFVEGGLEQEDLPPTFAAWQQRQQALRIEPDVNYRRWRTLADHQDYLQQQPELLRWLCALAVYPQPTWELTIAIGEALGLEITFDRLLLLSRIPWLQNGRLPPRLRDELLAGLDPDDETRARAAVKRELEAITGQTRDSHADIERQSSLAVQRFHLDPDDPGHQATIRQLLAEGLLTKIQVGELNRRVRRRQAAQESALQMSMSKIAGSEPADIHTFLADAAGRRAPERPLLTPDFWRAAILSTVFLGLGLAVWTLDSTETLYRWTFGQPQTIEPGGGVWQPRHYFFVKEDVFIDSAAIYNNQGVIRFADDLEPLLQVEPMTDLPRALAAASLSASDFQNALRVRPGYALASANYGRLFYDMGVRYYNAFLTDRDTTGLVAGAFLSGYFTGPNSLPLAAGDTLMLACFRAAATADSVRPDAHHALGLAHFYLGARDSALVYYRQLREAGYFDTLSLFPNLSTVAGAAESRIIAMEVTQNAPLTVTVGADYFLTPADAAGGQTTNQTRSVKRETRMPASALLELVPLDRGGRPAKGFQPAMAGAAPGRNQATLSLTPAAAATGLRTDSLRVRLLAAGGRELARRIIPFGKSWSAPSSLPDTRPPQDQPPTLKTQGIVNGYVVDAATAAPVSGAAVRLTEELRMEARAPRSWTATTDRSGAFRIDLGESVYREYRLDVTANGYPAYSAQIPGETLSKGEALTVRLAKQTATLDELMKALPVSLYFDDNEPGVNAAPAYDEIYERYTRQMNRYLRENQTQSAAPSRDSAEIVRFFQRVLPGELNRLHALLDQLIGYLAQGERAVLFMEGASLGQGDSAYNQSLAAQRILSVVNYMRKYKDGALQPHLDSGRLMIERSVVELPAPGPSKDLQSGESIYGIDSVRSRVVVIKNISAGQRGK